MLHAAFRGCSSAASCQMPAVPAFEHFGFQAAVETFVFAVGLRVQRTAAAGTDAQSDKPCGQVGQSALCAVAPGCAVVGVDSVGQSVLSECFGQCCLYAFPALVCQGAQDEVTEADDIQHFGVFYVLKRHLPR